MSELFTSESIGAAMASAEGAASETPASSEAPSSTTAGVLPAEGAATTPQVAADGSATTPTAQTEQKEADAKPTGPVPLDVHLRSMDNRGQKEYARGVEETKREYAFADAIPQKDRQTVGQFYQLLDTQPVQAAEVLIQQIAADPQHEPQLRSLVGKLLSRYRVPQQAAPAQAGGFPDADTEGVDDQGNHIPLYSATQMKAVVEHIKRELGAEYAPLKQDYVQRQTAKHDADMQRDASTAAEKDYQRYSQFRGFKEHEKEIAAAMHADHTLDVREAYIQVVIPKLDHDARRSLVASQHDKAAAASPNPANGAVATLPPTTDFRELVRREVGA